MVRAALADFEDLVRGFTYKPGCEVRWDSGNLARSNFQQFIHISLRVPDSCATSDWLIKIATRLEVPYYLTEKAQPWAQTRREFFEWLYREIANLECHEILENMRSNGKRIFDAHPDGGSASRPTHYLLDQ